MSAIPGIQQYRHTELITLFDLSITAETIDETSFSPEVDLPCVGATGAIMFTKTLSSIGNFHLKKPIDIQIELKGDEWLIFYDDLRLWGEGKSYYEALRAFEDYFLYDYKTYKKAKKLHPSAKKELDKYNQYV